MKALKPFDIAFTGLSNGKHDYFFDLDEDFFACFEGAEMTNPKLKGQLILHKKSNRLDLEFIVEGKTELICDRCLESFWHQMTIHKVLYIKFGETQEEQSDDVIVIPATRTHIDVSQYFFEFVVLQLPLRRVHPENKEGITECNPEVIAKLHTYLKSDQKPGDGDKDQPTDSRWDALKKIKFN